MPVQSDKGSVYKKSALDINGAHMSIIRSQKTNYKPLQKGGQKSSE